MKNAVASLLKGCAVVAFAVVLVISFFLNEPFFFKAELWLGTFLFCLLIYGAGEAISLLDEVRENTGILCKLIENAEKKEEEPQGWKCTACGEINATVSAACKKCGNYRE